MTDLSRRGEGTEEQGFEPLGRLEDVRDEDGHRGLSDRGPEEGVDEGVRTKVGQLQTPKGEGVAGWKGDTHLTKRKGSCRWMSCW